MKPNLITITSKTLNQRTSALLSIEGKCYKAQRMTADINQTDAHKVAVLKAAIDDILKAVIDGTEHKFKL